MNGTKSMQNKSSRVEVLKMERSFLGEIARRQTANLSAVLQRIGKIEEEIQKLQREEHEQRPAETHPEPVIGVEPDAP
jgi:prefoldin subunit 5